MTSASQRNIIQSPRKLRRVAQVVQGKPVLEALAMLKLMPQRSSVVMFKKMTEALANAQAFWNVEDFNFQVVSIAVDQGPVFKRFKPRAQGRIYQRKKRTSHLKVNLVRI